MQVQSKVSNCVVKTDTSIDQGVDFKRSHSLIHSFPLPNEPYASALIPYEIKPNIPSKVALYSQKVLK